MHKTIKFFMILIMVITLSGLTVFTVLATDEVPREKTLIFSMSNRCPTPDYWNPFLPNWLGDRGFHQSMIESLFYLNYESGEIMPWLASGYEYNADYSEVDIFIRDGVKWNDGVPFTAEDVVFTINMLRENAPRLNYSSEMKNQVKSVELVDEKTVRFILSNPNPRFILDNFAVRIWGMLPIVPKHIWQDIDPTTFKNEDAIFTGPYKPVQASSMRFVYDLRDEWWAAETGFASMPKPERLIWKLVQKEGRRIALMSKSQLDVSNVDSVNTLETIKDRNPNTITYQDGKPYAWMDPCPRTFGFNTLKEPWDDPEIRWAVNYAINRNAINNVVFAGTSEPAWTLFPPYAAMNRFADPIKDEMLEKYPLLTYDPKKTKEIFEEKGFTKGSDGIWVTSEGKRLTMTIISPTWPMMRKIANILAQQFQRVGIDAVPKVTEVSIWDETVANGKSDVFLHWNCASILGPYRTFGYLHSNWVKPVGERVMNNYVRYSNPKLDRISEQMEVISPLDPEMKQLFKKATEIYLNDLPLIPLTQTPQLIMFDTTYWENWPTAENNYIHPPMWWANALITLTQLEPVK